MQEVKNAPGFSVSAIAIRRHIGTLMLTVTVIVLGVFFSQPYKSISYHHYLP